MVFNSQPSNFKSDLSHFTGYILRLYRKTKRYFLFRRDMGRKLGIKIGKAKN